MNRTLRWGILGTGNIARQFTAGVVADGTGSKRTRVAAVASRAIDGARAFASTFNIPTAGDWQVTVTMFENAGGSSFEFFAAPGSHGGWSAAAFDLVGDTANGGLVVNAPIGVGAGATSIGIDTRAAMQNGATRVVW